MFEKVSRILVFLLCVWVSKVFYNIVSHIIGYSIALTDYFKISRHGSFNILVGMGVLLRSMTMLRRVANRLSVYRPFILWGMTWMLMDFIIGLICINIRSMRIRWLIMWTHLWRSCFSLDIRGGVNGLWLLSHEMILIYLYWYHFLLWSA